jgi:hypothetical protein
MSGGTNEEITIPPEWITLARVLDFESAVHHISPNLGNLRKFKDWSTSNSPVNQDQV